MHVRTLASVLATTTALFASSVAMADEPLPPLPTSAAAPAGPDTVELKDGTTLRGKLLEITRDVQVRLEVDGGRVATIKWEVIARVVQATPPPAPPLVPPPPPPPTAQTTLVHIDADAPVVLEQKGVLGDGGEWHEVCESPCDRQLPALASYRISGEGTRRSKPFNLLVAGGKLALDVQRGTNGGFAAGIALTAGGPILVFVGAIVATFGALKGSGQTYCVGAGGCGQTEDGSQLVVAGIILMGAGAVTTVVGAIILGGNVRTKVGQVPLVMTPPAAGPDLVRRPIWYADRSPVPATPFTIPIVSTTF